MDSYTLRSNLGTALAQGGHLGALEAGLCMPALLEGWAGKERFPRLR